ncbi:MAG: hypothetical protein CL915_08725 [Deltaproteobacteria bacterium]|nr:hypothetical protein [Deltaproteobacteria bacterium]
MKDQMQLNLQIITISPVCCKQRMEECLEISGKVGLAVKILRSTSTNLAAMTRICHDSLSDIKLLN